MAHFHKLGIIHRDIRPNNIMADFEEAPRIKLTNFASATKYTPGTEVAGKAGEVPFMAPEIMADDPYDERCDIWSVGVLLYRMISGAYPFEGDSEFDILS